MEIVQSGDAVLRMRAKEVPASEITSPEMQKLIKEMKDTLAAERLGVAIAAPQIGKSFRMFVVSGSALARRAEKDPKSVPDTVYINPVIVRMSKKKKPMHEGCLSVRGKWGMVMRAEKCQLHALDERGMPINVSASGLLAHIFQHEMDHLDGILYIDKATEITDEVEQHEQA